MIFLLFLVASLQMQNPMYFTLVATDCIVTGPVNGKQISSFAGTPWSATCVVQGSQLLIATMELDSRKPIGKESYNYTAVNGVGIGISKGGAIRYVFDFANQKFYHGQVNIIIEKGVVLTKTSVGRIEFTR